MIVLDTNALRGGGYGPATSASLLRGLAHETGHQLALPHEVVNECLASYERELAPLIEVGDAGLLLEKVPSWLGRADMARGVDGARPPSMASALNERRESLTERPSTRFLVLKTPVGAADEGIARERSRRPPATESGHEARDVVVWLTALEAATSERPSNVYFVSADKTFRGDRPDRLHPDLADEAPSNLRFFPNVDTLISRLSCSAVPAAGLSASSEVIAAVEETAIHGAWDPNHDLRRDLWDWAPHGVRFNDISAAAPELLAERGIASRRCGNTRLTAIDAVYQLDLTYSTGGAEPVPVTVRLGILVTDDDGDVVNARVMARGGIRPHARTEVVEEPNGSE